MSVLIVPGRSQLGGGSAELYPTAAPIERKSSMADSDDLAEQYGMRTLHERMPNGELRFRLIGPDGNSYIRTVAGPEGGWQNSHYHEHLRETYVIEDGWVVLAEQNRDGRVSFRRYLKGEVFTTEPLIRHNLYVGPNAQIHTIKHGGTGEADWHAASDLDLATKRLSEADLPI